MTQIIFAPERPASSKGAAELVRQTMDRQTSNNEDDWEVKLVDYMLGTMEPADAQSFEESLNECQRHVAVAREYIEVFGWLGASVPPAEPPNGHKTRLMSRVASTPQVSAHDTAASTQPPAADAPGGLRLLENQSPESDADVAASTGKPAEASRRQVSYLMPVFAAVAAVLLIFAGWWGWSAQNRLNIPSGYTAVAIQGKDNLKNASAVAFVNPSANSAYLVANGLQPLPAGEVYELWLLPAQTGAAPASAGTFTSNAAGTARSDVQPSGNLRDYVGFAVSIEPAPGGPKPTGPIVMTGNYSIP